METYIAFESYIFPIGLSSNPYKFAIAFNTRLNDVVPERFLLQCSVYLEILQKLFLYIY